MKPATQKVLGGTGSFLNDRLGGAKGVRTMMRKVFPDHWSFLLGEIALFSFVIVLLTGVFLTFFYKPSMQEIVYQGSYEPLVGSMMSEAYASTLELSFDVRGGLLMRQIHHWSALMMMAALCVHALRIFFTGAYRKPREFNWLIGILLFTLVMFEGLLGYTLPDDQLSGAGLRITQGVMQGIPVVGTYLYFILFGGELPGTDLIPRFYSIHILLIPAVILALVSVHLLLMFIQKHTQYPGKGRTDKNVIGGPFFPSMIAKQGAYFMWTFVIVAALSTFTQINPVWLYGPFSPADTSAGSQPDWYILPMEGFLRLMPSWEVTLFGEYTLALSVAIPALVPLGALMTGAALYPFVERWITKDNREHHVLDRPRNAPIRTGLGVSWVSFFAIAVLAGTNDLIADTFDVSLFATTWFFRVFIFVGPVVAFIVTRRICLGLQRRDAGLVSHGVERGVIMMSPDGEFTEVEEPLPAEPRAVIEGRKLDPGMPPAVDEGGVPAPGVRGALGRLQRRLNESYTGDYVPYDDHGNGHHAEEQSEITAGTHRE